MYTQRLKDLQSKLKPSTGGSILISNFFNIFYLCGIKTLTPEEREAFIFITKKNVYFFTDGRYLSDELSQKIASFGAVFKLIEQNKKLTDHLLEIVKIESLKSVTFEEEDLKYMEYVSLQKVGIELVPEKNIVTELREIKTTEEIAFVKKACELSDECLKELLPIIKVGLTEKELAWKMEEWIRSHGYELAFEPIVAVDQNSGIPHYDTKTGTGVIKDGSILLLDYGVRYQNYNSDITRMIFIGKQPPDVIKTYEGLLDAQEKTIQFIQKGKTLSGVDQLCREELEHNSLPNFSHSTGHGIGVEVHENPHLSPKSKDLLKPCQIFTVEPGVYYQGKYGMRIEDTVVITPDYQAVLLTQFPKKFLQI